MVIELEKIFNGHYINLEKWLKQYAGVEGVDYHFKYKSVPSRPDSARISEIIFTDPKIETLARIRWS